MEKVDSERRIGHLDLLHNFVLCHSAFWDALLHAHRGSLKIFKNLLQRTFNYPADS